MTLKAEFTPIGEVGKMQATHSMVASAADVRVFYDSAPAGFTLRDNEVAVEPNYGHRILGILKVRRSIGDRCILVQRDALAALREAAFAAGANAVVYATTPLAQEQNYQLCARANEAGEFGSGWAVVLGDAPANTPPKASTL